MLSYMASSSISQSIPNLYKHPTGGGGESEEGGCWTKECKRVLGPRELQSRAARSPPTVSSAPAEPQAVTPPPQHLSLYSFKLDLNNF